MKQPLYNVTKAGQELGVSAGTIRNLVARGELRAIRDVAGRRLFTPQEVARLKKKRAVRPRTTYEA